MIRLKILLLLAIFVIKQVSSECTASEFDQLGNCSAIFLYSLGISPDIDGISILTDLMMSWDNVENFCEKLNAFNECLEPSVIKNCIDREKDVQLMNNYMDVGFSFIHVGGNYVCGEGYETIKNTYSCALKYCEIDDTTCKTIKDSIYQCSVVAKHNCDKESIAMLDSILASRECFRNPDCDFCDQRVSERVKQYRTRLNAGKMYVLKEFIIAAESNDIDLQLDAITKLRKLLSDGKLPNDKIVKEEFFPAFVKYLSSKSSEVQAEAALTLKHLVDKAPENLEATVEAEIIPALIRSLISTDENVLENVIETLASLIFNHPELRNIYLDLNVLEPLFMSYSSGISKQMLDSMATILFYLPEDNVISYNFKTKNIVVEMIPTLAELVDNYHRMAIVNFIQGVLKIRFSQSTDKSIPRNIIGSCIKLLSHRDPNVRISTLKVLSIISKDETLIQYFLDKGILKIVQDIFHDDVVNWESTYIALKILTNTAAGNVDQIQAIFDAKLIPYLFDFLNHDDDTFQFGAISVLNRIIKNGSLQQLSTLIEMDLVKNFCQILKKLKTMDRDEIFLHPIVFDTITAILDKTGDKKVYAEFLKRGGMISSIYILNTHENKEVKKFAVSILERLF